MAETLDCGQAFRWRPLEDGSWEGVAGGRYLRLEARGEDLLLSGPGGEDTAFWRNYLDLDRDYPAIWERFRRNPPLRAALERCPGIRVLRQDRRHPLIGEFYQYVKREFPDYQEDIYLDRFTRNQRIALKLLERRMISLLHLIFKLKG